MNNERSLFAPEPFLQVPPTLACAIGLNEAIIAQHIYWLQHLPNGGKEIDGRRWVFNTYEQWQKIFPFWSVKTIQRIITNLEGQGHLISCQPEGTISRRKYYRIDEGSKAHLTHEKFNRDMVDKEINKLEKLNPLPCGQLDQMEED